jgi:leucyl-tRNA synthetase
MMELVNELYAFCGPSRSVPVGEEAEQVGAIERPSTISVLKEAIEALVLMLSPYTPHIAEEMWELLGHAGGIVEAGWPVYDEAVAKADQIVVPVQVNGKLRGRLTVAPDITEDDLKAAALADPQIRPHLEGKEIKKIVVARGRLVSIVVG